MTVFGGDIVNALDTNLANGLYVYSNAEPQNNTTSLSSDLQIAIPLGGRWAIDGVLFYRSTAAGGLKLNVMGDASGIPHANIRWGVETNTGMVFGNNTLNVTVPGTGFFRVAIWGVIDNVGGSAGTVTLQYAQTTSNAGPTGPLNGRWLRAHQIS